MESPERPPVTPRQHEGLRRGLSMLAIVTLLVLMVLVARGYHTLVLVLVGVIWVIGAFTFRYDRGETLTWLLLVTGIEMLSLMVQGYFTLSLILGLTGFGISALVFLYYEGSSLWSWWFPDQEINPTLKRWLRYLLQAATVGLSYAQARGYLNALTGVDPGNFPTALTALTALTTLVAWPVIITIVFMAISAIYAVGMLVAGLREQLRPDGAAEESQRWGFRAFGAVSVMLIAMAAYGIPADTPVVQRAVRLFVSYVLIATEFSYDRTCAVSSERRLVAQLKDRRERQVSLVSIAEEGPVAWFIFRQITFSTGRCDDPPPPAPTGSSDPPSAPWSIEP